MNTTNTNKKPLTRNKSLNISNDPLLTKKTKTENLGQQKQMPLILIPPSTVNARTDCQPTPHPVPSSPPSSQWLSDTTWHYCSPLLMRKRTNHRKKDPDQIKTKQSNSSMSSWLPNTGVQVSNDALLIWYNQRESIQNECESVWEARLMTKWKRTDSHKLILNWLDVFLTFNCILVVKTM